MRSARRALGLAGSVVLVVGTAAVLAQNRAGVEALQNAKNIPYNGRFTFVRLRYNNVGSGGFYFRRIPPWGHDYPTADRNFMKILNEVTNLGPNIDGDILSLDDPELFKYPVAYMCEPGFWTITDKEAEALHAYLLKGGFLIFDDFRGRDWENFEAQMKRVVPQGRFVELDASHPIFHSFFEINSLDFKQFYDRGRPVFSAMFEDNDPTKRLMIIANFNNDISEYWEWSDTGVQPVDLSNEAYKFGVNYIIYGMTH